MGQAKCRGSFEERKSEAIARNNQERECFELYKKQREQTMTPEERQRRAKAQILLAAMWGMAAPYSRLRFY